MLNLPEAECNENSGTTRYCPQLGMSLSLPRAAIEQELARFSQYENYPKNDL
jgi:hypothetical protein